MEIACDLMQDTILIFNWKHSPKAVSIACRHVTQ